MRRNIQFLTLVTLVTISLLSNISRVNASPEKAIAGFEKRIDALFKSESGRPLVRKKRKPPIKKNRGPYTRGYSYSIVAFAARCYYLGEKLDEADAAIEENAQYYLDTPAGIHDRDSFHWHAEIVLRLIEMYGSKGTKHAGRMSLKTETLALKPIWQYARTAWLKKAAYDEKSVWHHYGSENHQTMDFTIHWHFSKLAKDHIDYKNRKYRDGSNAAQQYKAWSTYFVAYCLSRAKKSICAEMRSDGYNTTWIKGFYNFHDFGEPKLKKAATLILDLYFAYWSEEQIDGHMGGGASRLKGNNAYTQSRNGKNSALAYYYFGMGAAPKNIHGHDVAAMTSSYRPPAVVADIAMDAKGRGCYEIRQRAQGLVVEGTRGNSFPVATAKNPPTQLRHDGGGIVRYSYCDPAFIMGTPMVEARPNLDWSGISAQNRWQGLIFAREGDPRIVPIVRPIDNRVCFNSFWSIQSKGTLITQKLKGHKGAGEMIVWIPSKGLPEPIEKNGMVFVNAEDAFAVIRVPIGGYQWREGGLDYTAETGELRKGPVGKVLQLKKNFAPVILEVMSKEKAGSFEAFQKMVTAAKTKMKGPILSYQTIYGETLTLDTSQASVPTTNGKKMNYTPEKVYDSPFLQSMYDSGIITIQKGKRKRVLDFNKLTFKDYTL